MNGCRSVSVAIALTMLVARTALADGPTPDQQAAAQALYDQAQVLVLQKNFAEACPKLAESVRLDPGLGAMLWLADCYENNGQTASAWAEFKRAAALAAERKDPREAVAKRRATTLEGRLSSIIIVRPRGAELPGLEIRRDGLPLATAQLGLPLPLDPGIHAIAASAPGHRAWSANVDVLSGRREPLIVNIPILDVDDTAAPAPVSPASPVEPSPPPTTTPPPAEDTGWSTTRILGFSAGAVGVVGLGVGAILGLAATSARNSSNANGHCLPDNECDATGSDKRHTAIGLANGATVGFIAGGVFLAGGLALFLFGPAHPTAATVVTPSVSAHEAGLSLARRF